ncbi:MAG: hypothetical protein NW241_20665 [Bacteroidia bacterium]|nr:hypothetical protein [Bacteroidia bacterium]
MEGFAKKPVQAAPLCRLDGMRGNAYICLTPIQTAMDATLDEIREILREVAIAQKNNEVRFQQTDERFQDIEARFRQTDERFQDIEARFRQTDAQFKRTDKRINEAFELFEGQWGKLIESLVEGDLIHLLQARDIEIHRVTQRVKGNHQGQNYEFDLIAHNGHEIVIIEVKTTMKARHVKEFTGKLAQARIWLPEYREYRVYGAMAFLRAEENSDAYAGNERLFVIRATGNSAMIVNPDEFVPRAF